MTKIIIDLEYDSENLILLEYLRHIDLNRVLGVCSVGGKFSENKSFEKINSLINKLKLGIKVFRGNSLPMMSPRQYIKGMNHEQNSLVCEPGTKGVASYKEMFDSVDEKIDIVCAGAVTNLAYFLKVYPRYKRNINKVILASGSFAYGSATPCSEHRVYYDAPAYDYLLSLPLNMYMIGLDEVGKIGIEVEDSFVISKEYNSYLGRDREFYVLPKNSIRSVLAAHYLFDESGFEFERFKCKVETQSSLTYAMTVVYKNGFDGIFKQPSGEYRWTEVSEEQKNINYLKAFEPKVTDKVVALMRGGMNG